MCEMTSVNLGKTLEHFKIQESLRFENLTEYSLCKGIFYMSLSTLPIIICFKSISEDRCCSMLMSVLA